MTAVGTTPSPAVIEYATELGRDCNVEGELEPADAAFSEATAERISSLSAVGGPANDRVPSSATDT
jgi:phosphotransacetylase